MNHIENAIEEMIQALTLLAHENEVRELRILDTAKGTVRGYFNDWEALAEAAERYNGQANIYVTLNPVKPALLARAENRVVERAKQTTSDVDIDRRCWFPIDFDPVRPAGISSTDEEHEAAIALAKEVRDQLREKGWPEPILADSGNGAHLLYYINLPNDEASTELIQKALQALDLKYSTDQVQIDTSTYNAARIWKLYGTVACKGDDTKERPHRQAQILECPDEIHIVQVELLQELADEMPEIEVPKKKNRRAERKGGTFDLEAWLSEQGLEVALKARWQNKATKYVLETCPWNEDHTNRSAYLIQFDDGGIAAGCHHNSCASQNWETLRDLLEPDWRQSKGRSPGDKGGDESQTDILIRLGNEAKFFRNEIEDAFAAVEVDGHIELMKVRGKQFKLWLTKKFFEETGKAPGMDAMNQALSVMEMKAMFGGNEHKLQLRVAEKDDTFYYDLADKEWRAVRISAHGVSIEKNPPILFVRNKNMKAQVEPDFSGDLLLILKHVRLKNPDDQVLYLVYIVSCFVPGIPHPVLVLSGEKGASKSTTLRMTRSIVDPAVRDLLTMPNSKQDLALTLANNYMPCFDNLDTLSVEKSDLICISSTGGGFSKRTLYSDDDETILEIQRCVGMNGINVVATRADLLDRSIVIELERIDDSERKEERELWEAFDADKPQIVGGAMRALSQAKAIYPNLKLNKLGRMADFTRWGYAIAEVLGLGGKRFLDAYFNNQNRSNEEAISAHPVAAAIVALMKGRKRYSASVASLLRELERVAETEKINTRVESFPKAAHMLSRRLKEVKSNLNQLGIIFDIRHAGDFKLVTIEKVNPSSTALENETDEIEEPVPARRLQRPALSGPTTNEGMVGCELEEEFEE
ncbi:hypothetical protein KDJ56_20390 [Brevibacillus composti]|uniref:RepB-like DNA primase domain-containing protein n=1 Tax=Brevibacillus composti TaxID=2796470 RepID=A0A7T5EK85_9BACL|nr:hypothetical protein [Brevibacillus composti]QQE74170.1 hypothetical protein JD108_20455 [Brevibacillus composti]QUO41253.1 hypothetical protein KDJ56_20390 [Brevibacillus composti]